MGVGKSTTAQQLAHDMGWNYVDLDAAVEKLNSSTINELTERFGLSTIRKLEAEALRGIADGQYQIIALGAGSLMNPESVDIIRRSGILVYLEAPEDTLLKRMVEDPAKDRPLLGALVADHRNNLNDPVAKAKVFERIKELLEQRLATYEKAEIEIKTEHKNIRAVAKELETTLNQKYFKASA